MRRTRYALRLQADFSSRPPKSPPPDTACREGAACVFDAGRSTILARRGRRIRMGLPVCTKSRGRKRATSVRRRTFVQAGSPYLVRNHLHHGRGPPPRARIRGMFFTIPTIFTWTRIVAIPLIVGVFYLNNLELPLRNLIATVMFVAFALTDWLDGYLARKLNQASSFGAFLDPVADKFLVSASLLILVHLHRADVFVALIIIGREIAISALREWMAQIGASKSVAVHMLGKVKTTVQMIAIPFLLYDGHLFGVIDTSLWGTGLIWIAAILTVWSMVYYLQKALPEIRKRVK
jgi:cardiolipin synthase (CMP-forming)